MRRKIFIINLLLIACAVVRAQGLNPTVEVNRAYEGKLLQAHKPDQIMVVPDSVLVFDLDFDYSVFSNPYRGAYEFKPYLVDMAPSPSPSGAASMYLRLGAGYGLRPSLDFVWSPRTGGPLKLDVYASHHSYFGWYRNIFASHKDEEHSYLRLASEGHKHYEPSPYRAHHRGYDSRTTAGTSGRYDWGAGTLSFNMGYEGLHTRDSLYRNAYNALDFMVRAQSHENDAQSFYYDAAIAYRYASLTEHAYQTLAEIDPLHIHDFTLEGSFGPAIGYSGRLLVDVLVDMSVYTSLLSSSTGLFSVTPKYVFSTGLWDFSLGARLATNISSDELWMGYAFGKRKSQYLYPDVNVSFRAIEDYLNLYFKLSGADRSQSFTRLIRKNHFFNPTFGFGQSPLCDNSVERLQVAIGAQGNIASHVGFDFRTGWSSYRGAAMETVYASKLYLGVPQDLTPGITYGDYNLFFADLSTSWSSPRFDAEGLLSFKKDNLKQRTGFGPALFSGIIKTRYNWNRRIYAGLTTDFSSVRLGAINIISGAVYDAASYNTHLPAFVNVGLNGEYVYNNRLSFWAEVDNLLDMTIQRSVLYPEPGLGFSLGLSLRL